MVGFAGFDGVHACVPSFGLGASRQLYGMQVTGGRVLVRVVRRPDPQDNAEVVRKMLVFSAVMS